MTPTAPPGRGLGSSRLMTTPPHDAGTPRQVASCCGTWILLLLLATAVLTAAGVAGRGR